MIADVKFALRMLAEAPGFAATAVLTLCHRHRRERSAATRWMSSLLYRVRADDLSTYGIVMMVLSGTALVATTCPHAVP